MQSPGQFSLVGEREGRLLPVSPCIHCSGGGSTWSRGGGVPGPGGEYLVLGGTWSGGVYLVWGCNWSQGMYLVWGVYPLGPGTPPRPGTHIPQDQLHIPARIRYTPRTRYTPQTRYIPPRTRYTPNQVHPQDQVHPLGPGTPPQTRYTPPRPGTPPGTRYTPRDTATAADGTHPT